MCETRRLRKKAKRLKEEVKFLKSVLKSKLLPKDVAVTAKIVPPMGTGKSASSEVILPQGTGKH